MNNESEYATIHRRFLELEDELDLFDLEIADIPVWERIRKGVYQQLRESLDEMEVVGTERSRSRSQVAEYADWLSLAGRNTFFKNPLRTEPNDVLFIGHPRRKHRDDGTWWDIYCDPLIEELDDEYVLFEHNWSNRHLTPAKTENIRYLDLIDFLGRLQRKLGIGSVTVDTATERRLETASERIRDEFGVGIDLVAKASNSVNLRNVTIGLYKRVLSRVDPEIAVIVVSYGKETFIEACKYYDVPVVELQHGIIHPYNLGYHFPGNCEKRAFPDYLFVFGDFWRRQAALPIPDERVISVGYPYLESNHERYGDMTSHEQMVFISQDGIGKQFSRLAIDLSNRDDFELDIVYKLHPVEAKFWQSAYPWLVDSDVTVVDGSDRSLHEVMAASTAQIGVGSTAVYEGLQFDLDTYLFDYPGVEKLAGLVEETDVPVVSSADELVTAVNRGRHHNAREIELFRPNATDNFRQALSGVRNS